MIRDREQPLNPPGIDAPDRKIKRQYIPMREYDDIEANGCCFIAQAIVESCDRNDEVSDLQLVRAFYYLDDRDNLASKFLDSYISRTGPTWRELIEREICRQAALLPGTAWEVEYEEEYHE
jgi:hypothetical protein